MQAGCRVSPCNVTGAKTGVAVAVRPALAHQPAASTSGRACEVSYGRGRGHASPRLRQRRPGALRVRASEAAGSADGAAARIAPPTLHEPPADEAYSLAETRTLVETAMLAAVSGLGYLLSTLLKLENSLGYFLPLPVILAAARGGVGAGWRTMSATAFLLIVLLGPLRAITYAMMHGVLAASLGTLWRWQVPWAVSIPVGAAIRMGGQLAYLMLSSVTMNENLFAVLIANVHSLLDQLSAAVGWSGTPSVVAVVSMIFALLLVNGLCYVFLLHVIYWFVLSSMGYRMGPLPGFIKRYLMPPPEAQTPQQQQQQRRQP